MDAIRIIPCLDVKDGRLVKGVNFIDLKDVGDPAEVAMGYSAQGADELVFLDITATVENRPTMYCAVTKTVESINIPLTVGGGIGDLRAIEELLNAGATRVSINTAAIKSPPFIEEAAKEFGSETIVVAIDTIESDKMESGFEVVVKGGTVGTGRDAVQWAQEAQDRGAGQLLPTSMDKDGTQDGYDIPMTQAISSSVSIPVIASGGAGSLEHLYEAVVEGQAKAVLVASIFHFGKHTIREAKEYLSEKGITVNM